MKINFKIFVLPLFLLLFSCSSRIENTNPEILSGKLAGSKISELKIKIPNNWFLVDNTEFKHLDIWLMKNDYSASISFVPLFLDDESQAGVLANDLKPIIKYSRISNKIRVGEGFRITAPEKYFELNKKKFAGYSYLDKNGQTTIVHIFSYNDKYFEVSTSSFGNAGKEKNEFQLRQITEAVLSSIQ